METIIPLLIQLIGGGAGGNIVAAVLKNLDLNKVVATIAGVLGGIGGGQIAGLIPALEGLLNAGVGGGSILANGGASAVGGALLTAIVGFIKKAMAPKA